MKVKTLIIIMALLSLIWGIGFILMPKFFWSLYGLSLDTGGVYMSRQLGVVFFILGLVLWLARNTQEALAVRAISLGLFVGNILGFVVALIGQFSAGISLLGWVGVACYLLLAAGFGVFLLRLRNVGK